MKKSISSVIIYFVVICMTFFSTDVESQSINKTEGPPRPDRMGIESVVSLFSDALENVRLKYGASQEEFSTFYRFETNPIHLLKADVMAKARKARPRPNGEAGRADESFGRGNFDPALLSALSKETEKNLGLLYEKFLNTKKRYPSSVEEYATFSQRDPFGHSPLTNNFCDSAGCSNIGFEDGNLSSWYGYYAENNSDTTNVIINGNVGGLLGAVTEGCNDPTVMNYMANAANGIQNINLSTDYQISITSSGYDHIVPAIPRVSPWGGSHSVMLGDSDLVGQGVAILSKTFLVSPNTSNLTYQYAVFLNNPNHVPSQQPFFIIAVLDENGDTIRNCGIYKVVSGYGIQGFDSTYYNGYDGFDIVYYRNWTVVSLSLKRYIGQCVTIVFEVADCALGGHFGYAYVDASCSPSNIISSSPNFCGQDSISLAAPPGSTNYRWTGPANSILSGAAQQTVWVKSAGVYKVIMTPVTGSSCADTLSDTIGNLPGPPPKPDFYTVATCAGQPTSFINTSTNSASADFYWDFYNLGIYNDTDIVNPTWTYASPGTYDVKLHEIYKGCGNDTVIPVKIYGSVIGGFTVSPACAGSAVSMTNTSTGALSYLWNYGDPASGTSDTSSAANGSHSYSNTGTYTITLISKNSSTCADTTKHVITVSASPKPFITGKDSVCPNYEDTLTATGGTTYTWSTGTTGSSIIVTSATTQTITVEAYIGPCSHDTSFILHRVSPAPIITASKDSICQGDTAKLTAGGSVNYRWSTQNTSTSINVSPKSTTTYTLYATRGLCTDSATIIITVLKAVTSTISISQDTVCIGSPTTLTVITPPGAPAVTYKWNTGAVTSYISPSPDSNTVYTVHISNRFCSKDTSINVFVKPVPPLVIIGSSGDTLCVGQSIPLNVSGAAGYAWNPPTGLNCTDCPNPTATPTTTTAYVVTGYDTDRCTTTKTINILVETHPVLGILPSQSTCSGNLVTLQANEISGFYGVFTWEPGGSTNSTITVSPDASTVYTVQYQNKCGTASVSDTVFVKVSPISLFSADITEGCAPLCVRFRDLSTIPSGSITQWSWVYGNGDTSYAKSPLYCYPDTGVFTVTHTAVSGNGCSASLKVVQMITVFSKPVANFIYAPQPISILEPTVQFTGQSTDAYGIVKQMWNFGDNSDSASTLKNPTHTYTDTGMYCPQMLVVNNKGCIDTITNCLEVEPIFTLYIPSAFSPNGDGLNDIFIPKGKYIKDFEMYIFDRWGEELYHTTDINKGWNGTVKGNGPICQEDSYVYKISATDFSNKQHSYTGVVTLIK